MGIKTKLNVRLAIRQRADLFEANILANKISLLQGQSLERTSRFHLHFEWTCAFKCFYFTTIKACLKMPRMLCLCLVPRRLSLSRRKCRLSLAIHYQSLACTLWPGGPCPSPNFLCEIINTEIAACLRLQQTAKIHRLIPKIDSSPSGNYLSLNDP